MSNKKIASQKIDKEQDVSNLLKNETNKNDNKAKNHQKILDDLKKEKENSNNSEKNNNKNNKEKNISFFTYNAKIALIATVIIVLIIIIFKLYAYNEKSIKNTKNNNVNTVKIQTNNKKTNTNAKIIDNSSKIKELQDDINDLEKKLSYNDEYIKTLEDKIVELENIIEIQKNHLDSSNINKVQILLDIQKDIQNGKSYSYNLSKLETIDTDGAMKDNIAILKQYEDNYVNKKIINDDFNQESKIFLNENNILKNSNSTFAKFLSNFVVVRKINKTNENSADNFLLKLEDYLQKDEYLNVINLLENNNEYNKYFNNTLNNLKEYTLLDSTVEKMINNFTNK